MKLLDRYLAMHFARATLLVAALLLVLFSFIGLTDELENVGSGTFGTGDAVAVVLLTLPRRLVDLLPVSALLGAVLGIGALANHREIVAMRAAGLPASTLARAPCLVAVALAAVTIVAENRLIPMAESKAREFRSRTLAQTALGDAEFWSRHANRFVRVGEVDFGQIPRDIEIYELGEHAQLRRMLLADRAAILDAHTWRLYDVEEKILGPSSVEQRVLPTLDWDSFLTPEQISALITPAEALSALDLYRYVREVKGGGIDTHHQEMLFWHRVSAPVALLGMTLLGLPFVFAAVRARSTGFRLMIGGVAGISFYLLEQIAGQIAAIAELPPLPSALAPVGLLFVLAVVGFRRLT